MLQDRPIGIFDSGIGGLTVLQQIAGRLPAEDLVYFGDTARVPYGSKSSRTVIRFAREDCRFLLQFDPKMIVVACNTASSFALDRLREDFDIPVCGVIEPGARAAVQATVSGRVGVIATQATVNSEAYKKIIHRLDSSVEVFQKAAPLLVPIVEEGRAADDPVTTAVLEGYLEDIGRAEVDVLVLGCTHYPLLKSAIARIMGPKVQLVDSARQTAISVVEILKEADLLRVDRGLAGTRRFLCSDNPKSFAAIASVFLTEPIESVIHADPEKFFSNETTFK